MITQIDVNYIIDITLAVADSIIEYSPMHQPCEPLVSYADEIKSAVKYVLRIDENEIITIQ